MLNNSIPAAVIGCHRPLGVVKALRTSFQRQRRSTLSHRMTPLRLIATANYDRDLPPSVRRFFGSLARQMSDLMSWRQEELDRIERALREVEADQPELWSMTTSMRPSSLTPSKCPMSRSASGSPCSCPMSALPSDSAGKRSISTPC
jgi:hypothetical protein